MRSRRTPSRAGFPRGVPTLGSLRSTTDPDSRPDLEATVARSTEIVAAGEGRPGRPGRPHLQPPAQGADHLPRLRGARRQRQRDLRPDAAARRRGPRARTSGSTSTPRVARSPPAWRSTTPCSASPTTSPPSRWAWPPRWASSCSRAGDAGQALRHAARAGHDAPALGRHRRHGLRHQDPGRADALHQEADGRAHRPAHRPDRSSRSRRDSDRDRWFTAEEAKEYGFVDHVFSRRRRRWPASPGPTATGDRD